ncbi:efflux RND transporter periplasmic adaptor subunit [Oscillibacter sp.]|uniref:efflux RND transporter periplasmic adaptor subunit n=1 Tax=Oscillibacter sp. TaxID=1945593 RepID=UPI0028A1B84A|nr:efflux RND transporter periplasmic adaptor subunit [Oscillibacter sp.]
MKTKSLSALLTAALLLGTLTGCGQTGDSSEEEVKGTAVEIQTVELGDIATESTVTGSVTANRNVPVLSKVSCKVKSVTAKAGDAVAAGDALFTLDTADLRDTYGSALETYSGTRELLDEQVSQAREGYENLQALFALGAVSQNQVDQAKLGLLQAENARKSTLTQMGLDDVWDILNSPTVTAPIAGTVSSVSVTAGVAVGPGTVGAVISEIGHPQVVVNVSETLQPSIGVGDAVEISIPSVGETTVQGTVSSVASAVSLPSALYEVHIDLPKDMKVSIGMFARATFRTDSRTGTVLIPTEAILTGEDGSRSVYVVDGDTAYQVNVTTGLVGEKQTEITSGLHGGEQLVTRGQSYLNDGAPVRVTNAPAPEVGVDTSDSDTSGAESGAASSAAVASQSAAQSAEGKAA